ncbi:Kunitz trypsin inhibitor [Quillaja saponaria]|uniref:Kunitz trypsin inhibitor n=1 Tax=Quillaja saponaria TaxID=32244 RepID=A0AAD7Q5V4_QUISA|nr:Kunitz trypsin inhibitor [Quillaja saponaria]
MKTTSPLLVAFSSFLLFAFITKPLIAAAEPVLDTDGEQLQWGVKYYILPVFRGRGGGLTLADSKYCPLNVVQEHSELSNGLPLTFTPGFSKLPFVQTSSDLNIEFSGASICVQSLIWRLVESKGIWFVSTGGKKHEPSLTSWFKIERDGDDYKLVFCPKSSEIPYLCGDLAIYIVGSETNELRRLALGEYDSQAFVVKFKKASSISKTEYLETVV